MKKTAIVMIAVLVSAYVATGFSLPVCAMDLDAITAKPTAKKLLAESGVAGGVIVHVGVVDGALTAALRPNDSYLVQGLSRDRETVAEARSTIRRLGLYGPVSVVHWTGSALPYAEESVNLLVISDNSAKVTQQEIERVLAPLGVVLRIENGTVKKDTKSWPADIDQWTHYLHGPNNNAVAADRRVGPPRRLRWTAAPTWARHHDFISSFTAAVSSEGRLFYVHDDGPRHSVLLPANWTVSARDAFNGKRLWKRPLPSWHPHHWSLKSGPAELPRRLVALDGRVYLPLGLAGPLVALDAATGQTVHTYEGTEGVRELIVSEGAIYVVVDPGLVEDVARKPGESLNEYRRSRFNHSWKGTPVELKAIDAPSGRTRWTHKSRIVPLSLTVAKRKVCLHDGASIRCLDAADGKELWVSKPVPRMPEIGTWFAPTLVMHDDLVLWAGGEHTVRHSRMRKGADPDRLFALDAKTGKVLWNASHLQSGYDSPKDIFIVDGKAWFSEIVQGKSSGLTVGIDVRTGEEAVRFMPDDGGYHMPHHRCHRAKATERYMVASRTGIDFVDLKEKHWDSSHWVRGACLYGTMPCNGLLYTFPHSCACNIQAMLKGINGLAGELQKEPSVDDSGSRTELLQRVAANSAEKPRAGADWPTYRGNNERSGYVAMKAPEIDAEIWRTKIGGKLTSPVLSGQYLYVASIDAHTLYALDHKSGEVAWDFVAGGRIDSPPTVWKGVVLFGCCDGWVYCLVSQTGELAWRTRAAPREQYIGSYDQLESTWPVHGSVLVNDGVVYCVAGRSKFLDGGLHMLRIDAATGEILTENILGHIDPITGKSLQKTEVWPEMRVALPDVLSCDGESVYMRRERFDLKWGSIARPETELRKAGSPLMAYKHQKGPGQHLFSPIGFLDDSWWHRAYWTYGRNFSGGYTHYYGAARYTPSGRILCFNDTTVFGYGRKPLQIRGQAADYQLFAAGKNAPVVDYGRKESNTWPPPSKRIDHKWTVDVPLHVRAMVVADKTIYIAGPPRVLNDSTLYNTVTDAGLLGKSKEEASAYRGDKGAILQAVSAADGGKVTERKLDVLPVFDGMIAAAGKIVLTMQDGSVRAFGRN